jgi:hypothetical protein
MYTNSTHDTALKIMTEGAADLDLFVDDSLEPELFVNEDPPTLDDLTRYNRNQDSNK